MSKLSSPWLYFIFTVGWSWLCWIPAALLGISISTAPGLVFGLLGVIGPMVGGIAFTYLTGDSERRKDYWRRIIDVKRISARWWLVIIFFVPVLMSLAAGMDLLLGGSVEPFKKAIAPFLASPLSIIPTALFVMFIGPFPEELGWRGYVLDRLQEKMNALASSLALGAVWAIWHFPLFFIKDTYQYNQGAWSEWFWLFFLGIVPLSVVFAWIFNNTGRSTLAIILFHFNVVFTDELLNLTANTNRISTGLWILIAVVVTIVRGKGQLSRKQSPKSAPQ